MNDHPHAPVFDNNDIAEMRANYAGNVTLIDEQIGEIIQVLTDKGILNQTVIVFTSDHGEMNGDYELIYKENFLNSAVKVPLIIWTPDLRQSPHAGTIYDGMVEMFDVGPTLCEFASGQLHHQQFAKSLVPVVNDPGLIHRTEAISEIHGEISVQNNQWKMAINRRGEPYLLFNLQEDSNEQCDLVGKPEMQYVIDSLERKILERLITSQVYHT